MFGAKQEPRELPVDRVRAMMRTGMSEKDIVRQLKAEGYSFGEIEKSLMAVVKAGAVPLAQGAELGMPQRAPPVQAPPMPVLPSPPPAPPPVEMPAPPQMQPPVQPYVEYPVPQYPAPQYPYAAEEEELQPEVIMEELIESVAEEKFEKFNADIKRLENEIERLQSDLSVTRERAEKKPAPELPKELAERINSIEVRIGGLEKAFRQILPQLSENINAISRMIAERKRQMQYSSPQPR